MSQLPTNPLLIEEEIATQVQGKTLSTKVIFFKKNWGQDKSDYFTPLFVKHSRLE
jgi:hypothetical protein